jgi:hypothetical protein
MKTSTPHSLLTSARVLRNSVRLTGVCLASVLADQRQVLSSLPLEQRGHAEFNLTAKWGTLLIAPTGQSAILLPSALFPCVSYRADLLQRFLYGGIQDFSSFHRVPVTVSPPLPRRCGTTPYASLKYPMLSSPIFERLDRRRSLTRLAQRSLKLHPGNSSSARS